MSKKKKDKKAKVPSEPVLDAGDNETQGQTVLMAPSEDGQDKPAAARPKKSGKKQAVGKKKKDKKAKTPSEPILDAGDGDAQA